MAETVTSTANEHPAVSLPREVQLFREDVAAAAFTPRQLRLVRDTYGRSHTEIVQDDHSDDRFVVFAWLKLQEEHGAFPVELMDDVRIRIKANADGTDLLSAEPDPTGGESSSSLPDSAERGA